MSRKTGKSGTCTDFDRHKELTQSKGRMSTEEQLYKAQRLERLEKTGNHKTVSVIGALTVTDIEAR